MLGNPNALQNIAMPASVSFPYDYQYNLMLIKCKYLNNIQ